MTKENMKKGIDQAYKLIQDFEIETGGEAKNMHEFLFGLLQMTTAILRLTRTDAQIMTITNEILKLHNKNEDVKKAH